MVLDVTFSNLTYVGLKSTHIYTNINESRMNLNGPLLLYTELNSDPHAELAVV